VKIPKAPWPYLAAAAFFWAPVGAAGGYAFKAGTTAKTASFETPATVVVASKVFPGTRTTWVGGGTFRVPLQVPPGGYVVTGSGTFGCSWFRLSATDNQLRSVIASGSVSRGGVDEFTVVPGDRFLRLLGDCTWARQP